MAVALKERNETEYGIELLRETSYLNAEEAASIINDDKEFPRMLISTINSVKARIAQ